LKSCLKITFRKFIRDPLYPFISIICLGLGITCALFIIIWIRDELSYDSFHNKAGRIYRLTVEINNKSSGYHTHFARCWIDWLKDIQENIPGIEGVARLTYWPGSIIMADERAFESVFCKTDTSFIDLFSLYFISGNPKTALQKPYTVLLSESAAHKYYGKQDPLGKTILQYCSRCREKIEYTVVGVVKDMPLNSHFHFDVLAPYENPDEYRGWAYYYLLLEPNKNPEEILEDFIPFARKYNSDDEVSKFTPHLQKVTDIHLLSNKARELERNGSMQNLYLFAGLALFILFVAVFNHINLQYVGLIKNYKSIRVIKYAGAIGSNIFSWLLVESVIYGTLSSALAVLIFKLLLPSFNNIMGKQSEAALSLLPSTLAISVPLIILFISLAGIFPYMLLKSMLKSGPAGSPLNHNPLNLSLITTRKFGLTKIMVTGQYIAVIVLIITVFTVTRQINFFMGSRLGSQNNNIICVKNVPVQVINKYQVFKAELLSNKLIRNVTSSFQDPAYEVMDAMPFETTGAEEEMNDKILWVYPVDDNFFSFYNINVVEGYDFPPYYGNDTIREYYILNRKALDHLGWKPEEAVGRPFSLIFNLNGRNLFKGGKIIGIVDDFQVSSMKDEIKPYVFFQKSFWLGSVQVEYDSLHTKSSLDFIDKTWHSIFPGFPFDYEFVDDLYRSIYANEIRFKKLSMALGIIAIVLSCLGLWGISGITQHIRTKEIGIRKTNGATALSILIMLLKDVFLIIAVSALVAMPLSYFILEGWLKNYAYRINISWWILALSLLITSFIALITVSWQSYKAASGNPVRALRYE
jgi:putative ABC transport system permease protein